MRFLGMVALALISGHVSAASIKEIVSDPRTYVNKTVTINGEVTGELSLFVFKYFTVSDGTGAINVITERPLPKRGQKIKVVGKVREVFSFGRETLLVLIEEDDSGTQLEKTKVTVTTR